MENEDSLRSLFGFGLTIFITEDVAGGHRNAVADGQFCGPLTSGSRYVHDTDRFGEEVIGGFVHRFKGHPVTVPLLTFKHMKPPWPSILDRGT